MRLGPDGLVLLKLFIAGGGAVLLLWDHLARRRGGGDGTRRLRDGLLLSLGIFAGLGWWNFGLFHGTYYVHRWEAFHYYLGAKYFPELGYTRLYLCSAAIDVERGVVLGPRLLRDLETKQLRRADELLADPAAACTRRFTPERWTAFKADVDWFRRLFPADRWATLHRDYGYNPTPVWGLLGTTLASLAPASWMSVTALALIDPVLLLAMWALVWRAFGWRPLCVALLFWGTNHMARWGWNGGGYLRQDWLVLAVAGVCLLRLGRPAWAGMVLGWSALLRVFPLLLLGGVALEALWRCWRQRKLALAPEHRRLALGVLAAAAVLVPLATWVGGGPGAWREFALNVARHDASPLQNRIGLRPVVAYEHATRAAATAGLKLDEDAFDVWKEARRRVFAERRPVFFALAAAWVALLAWAVRGKQSWVAAALSVGCIPVFTDPSTYYYSVLLIYGLLWARYREVGVGLCVLSVVSGLVPRIVHQPDVAYVLLSLAVLAFVTLAALRAALDRETTAAR